MKNSAYEPLSDVVGELWATHRRSQFDEHTIDIVIPMPLHWSRRWSRGYNQSDNLARAVARVIGKPCDRNALVRRKATVNQKGLSAAERWRNMTGAFRPGRTMVKNMRVLLIDDVMTTGATADAAARTLLEAGAAQVRLAVVAHG
jgi:ComF family protein